MNDVLLNVDQVGKKYSRSLQSSIKYGVRDVLSEMTHTRDGSILRDNEFWALKNINFSLKRGECLALLGTNGAGKSTLLKVLAGSLLPDTGKVEKRGRMERLIELSAGFKPTLTGRENVQLKGRLIGFSKSELKRRMDEIVDFAELEDSFDMPVQFYSSGMKSRLGFALSVAMEPDILLIDEVLAVGDLGFRMKCYSRVDEMRKNSAVILVSHSINHVSRMATSGLVLHKGNVVQQGDPQEAIKKYQELSGVSRPQKEISYNPQFVEFTIFNEIGPLLDDGEIHHESSVFIRGKNHSDESVFIHAIVHQSAGAAIADWTSRRSGFKVPSGASFKVALGKLGLCPGYYHLVLVGMNGQGEQKFLSKPYRFRAMGDYFSSIPFQPSAEWSFE